MRTLRHWRRRREWTLSVKDELLDEVNGDARERVLQRLRSGKVHKADWSPFGDGYGSFGGTVARVEGSTP